MAFGPDGALYIVGNNSQGNRTQCTLRALGPDSAAGWRTVFTTDWYAQSNTAFDHHCNGILVSPDNQTIYVNSGSRTDHGEVEDNGGAFPGLREEPLTSAILRVPVAASGLTLPNDEAALKAGGWLFADGVRNAFDLAYGPQGQLYAIDNGPDADYPEELNALRAGAHYGFPWRFGMQDNPQRAPGYNPAADPHLHQDFVAVRAGAYHDDPDFPPPPAQFVDPLTNSGPAANEYRADDGGAARGALNTFTPHRSPLGLNFDLAGALSGDLKYAGFVLSYGAAGGTLSDRGQDLLALRLSGNSLSATQLATGFDHPIDAVLTGHVLYVLENGGNGAIWAITLP